MEAENALRPADKSVASSDTAQTVLCYLHFAAFLVPATRICASTLLHFQAPKVSMG